MEYAAPLPKTPSRRTIVAPIIALLVGAGAATGAYALIDNGDTVAQPAKVIVVEKPGPNAAAIPGKNEASTAAAISQSGIELRGSKASATGTQSSDTQSAAQANRTDPHGPASFLH
jgi:hypothetical protein